MGTHVKHRRIDQRTISRLQHAGEAVIDFSDETQKSVVKHIDDLSKQMKKHPVATIGLGVAVGYLLARLVHR